MAMVLTSAERAADLDVTPAYVTGFGMGSGPQMTAMTFYYGDELGVTPSRYVAPELWRNTGLTPKDIDVVQFYDAFTPQIPLGFEEYGFCGEGEAPAYMADGRAPALQHERRRALGGVRPRLQPAGRGRASGARHVDDAGAERPALARDQRQRRADRRDRVLEGAVVSRDRRQRRLSGAGRRPGHAAVLGRLRARRAPHPALRRAAGSGSGSRGRSARPARRPEPVWTQGHRRRRDRVVDGDAAADAARPSRRWCRSSCCW